MVQWSAAALTTMGPGSRKHGAAVSDKNDRGRASLGCTAEPQPGRRAEMWLAIYRL